MRKNCKKWCIRLREHHVDRAGVLGADLTDDPGMSSQEPRDDWLTGGSLRVTGENFALETFDDVLGSECRSIVKADTRPQPEGPDEPVLGHRPLHRERRLDVAAAGRVLYERVEGLTSDERDCTFERRGRIDLQGHRGHADSQGAALG